MYATRRINLRHLNNEEKNLLRNLCILSKTVYNQALKNTSDHYAKTGQFLFWKSNYKLIKTNCAYKEMGSRYQAVLKEVDSNYRTYMTTVRNGILYNANNGWKTAQPPDCKKHYFPIICENFEQRDGKIKLPMSRLYRKLYKDIYFELPNDLKEIKIKKFVVRPKFYDMEEFELLLIYEVMKTNFELSYDEVLAIDLGVSNFATCATSQGNSFIIDGKKIKSINYYFQKNISKCNCMKAKQKYKGYTKKYRKLMNNRFNQIEDYLNKSVNHIIHHCLENMIGNIIVGYGDNFQNSPNLGHVNNQVFSQMPYFRFINKLKFQCAKYGIEFMTIDECYTSKSSFYDDDPLPDRISRKKYEFSGKRKYRGLYISSDGRTINADLNGACNIMRKCKLVRQNVIKSLQRNGIAQPERIRIN